MRCSASSICDGIVCLLGGGVGGGEGGQQAEQKFFCQSYFHLFALWAGKQTILVAFIQQYIEFSYILYCTQCPGQ